MLAVLRVMTMAMAMSALTGRHGGATFLTELAPLGVHASRDFGDVWNDVGTKPHRVRGAGLAYIDGLGSGPAQPTEQRADGQRQPTNKMGDSHQFLPGLKRSFAPSGK
jgi:hypothetical protein